MCNWILKIKKFVRYKSKFLLTLKKLKQLTLTTDWKEFCCFTILLIAKYKFFVYPTRTAWRGGETVSCRRRHLKKEVHFVCNILA